MQRLAASGLQQCLVVLLLLNTVFSCLVAATPNCTSVEQTCKQTTAQTLSSGDQAFVAPLLSPLMLEQALKVEKDLASLLMFRRMGNYEMCTNDAQSHMCIFEFHQLEWQIGVCLPKECTIEMHLQSLGCKGVDLETAAAMAAIKYHNLKNLSADVEAMVDGLKGLYKGYGGWCHDDHTTVGAAITPSDPHFDSGAMACVIAISIIVALSIVLSFFKPPCSVFQGLDFRSSWNDLVSVRPPGLLSHLDCIRTLAMADIILGHTFMVIADIAPNANPAVFTFGQSIGNLFVMNAQFSVDTFFWLSGFFCAHSFIRAQERMQRTPSYGGALQMWGLGIVHRWWRLTPVYMVMVAYWINVAPYAVQGPLWNLFPRINYNEYCRSHWWQEMVYLTNINALTGEDAAVKTCTGWTWYLTLDMQMFIVAALLLSLRAIPRLRKMVNGLIVLCIFGSVFEAWFHSYKLNAPWGLNTPATAQYLYCDVFGRASPFFIGVASGIFWNHHRKAPEGWVAWGCGLFGMSMMLGNVFLPYSNMPENGFAAGPGEKWPQQFTNLYNALSRALWGLDMSLICWALMALPAWILKPMNWSGWSVLAKLTYGAYLWHQIVVRSILYSSKDYIVFTPFNAVCQWIIFVFIAFSVAAVGFILIEAPSGKLDPVTLMMKSRSKPSRQESSAREVSPEPLLPGSSPGESSLQTNGAQARLV